MKMGLPVVLLLLLLWTESTLSYNAKRIYGGQDCKNTERQYHVLLQTTEQVYPEIFGWQIRIERLRKTKKYYVCGGSLIHEKWVLTADHCYTTKDETKKIVLEVFIGVHPDEAMCMQTIKKVHRSQDKSDILLLELPQAVPPVTIVPVTLPTCTPSIPPRAGRPATPSQPTNPPTQIQVAGYITHEADEKDNKVKKEILNFQCVDLPVTKCPVNCLTDKDYPENKQLCYIEDATKGVGPGDSGGGVVHNKVLYGVHVAGINVVCTGTQRALGWSMNVCAYLTWINGIIHPQSPG